MLFYRRAAKQCNRDITVRAAKQCNRDITVRAVIFGHGRDTAAPFYLVP